MFVLEIIAYTIIFPYLDYTFSRGKRYKILHFSRENKKGLPYGSPFISM